MSDEASVLNPSTTRREFARVAVAVVAVPVLAPLAGCTSAAPPTPGPTPTPAAPVAPPTAPSTPAQQQGNQQAPDPVAVHLTEGLKAKYGDRLTDAQWEEVRRSVEGNLRAARQLRAFELPIQTEPAFVFRAYRGGGG